jgi:hypothetical protein
MPQSELQWVEDGVVNGVQSVENFFGQLFAMFRPSPGTSSRPPRSCTFEQNNTYVQNNVHITNYTNVYNGVKRKRNRRRYLG